MNSAPPAGTAAQALEAGRAQLLAAFGAKAAHDFNNLLAVIMGNAELIEEMVPDDDVAPMLRLIREAGERGEQLAAQLMHVSGGEAGPSALDDFPSSAAAAEAKVQKILGTPLHIALSAEGTSLAAAEGPALESALLHLCVSLRAILPEGGRLSIEVSPAAAD